MIDDTILYCGSISKIAVVIVGIIFASISFFLCFYWLCENFFFYL